MDPVPTFNCSLKDQPIASEILIQPIRYKRTEINLLADEKGPQDRVQIVVYTSIVITFIVSIK